MKGKKFYVFMLACLLAGSMMFSACNMGNNTSGNDSLQGQNASIENVYAQYVAYAQQNGQTPMSYEEWLSTVKGADGKDGKSAYEIWLANGYTGTQSDFLEWLKGEKGEQGETGAQGPQGTQGVGIQNITTDANGDLIVTYTDGTTQKIVMPKEEVHVHNFSNWLIYDEAEGLLYRICDDCRAVEWTTSMVATTAEELIYAANQGGVVTINENIALDTTLYTTKDITVNLNANISIPNDTVGDGVFCVKKGTLTLNGNGTVNAANASGWAMAFWADGGNVVINGGTYTNVDSTSTDSQLDLIYVKNGGKVTINGGEFKCKTPRWTLNSSNGDRKGTIEVKGGKFYKFNPAAADTEDNGAGVLVNYVADGYKVVQNGDWYEVVKVGEANGKDALIQAAKNGGVVTINENIALDTALYTTKDITVNLNANISIPNDKVGDGVFCVKKGTLTINGNGTVNGKSAADCDYSMAIWADGGNVVINGGTYTTEGAKAIDENGNRNNNEVIYVKNGGKVTINGGTFICENPAFTLNSHNTQVGTIEVKGGKFYKFNPATDAEDATIYVAEGYKVVQNGDWYEVVKA